MNFVTMFDGPPELCVGDQPTVEDNLDIEFKANNCQELFFGPSSIPITSLNSTQRAEILFPSTHPNISALLRLEPSDYKSLKDNFHTHASIKRVKSIVKKVVQSSFLGTTSEDM